jgi:hypothetical protein
MALSAQFSLLHSRQENLGCTRPPVLPPIPPGTGGTGGTGILAVGLRHWRRALEASSNRR